MLIAQVGWGYAQDTVSLSGTPPTFNLLVPAPGQTFAPEVSTSSRISYQTDLTIGFRKITAEITGLAGNFPAGTQMQVSVSPTTGTGVGNTIILTTLSQTLISQIPAATEIIDLILTYTFTASLDAAPVSNESRTITYSIMFDN
jgi:hypothetical protein